MYEELMAELDEIEVQKQEIETFGFCDMDSILCNQTWTFILVVWVLCFGFGNWILMFLFWYWNSMFGFGSEY